MMNSVQRSAFEALPSLPPDSAAYYLSDGELHLKGAILSQMRRDYGATLLRLYFEAAKYSGMTDAPELGNGPSGDSTQSEDYYELRSVGLRDTAQLMSSGEPEQAFHWATSEHAAFESQTFRMTDIRSWGAHRGLLGAPPSAEGLTLNPKERTALQRIIAVLVGMHPKLDLAHHSNVARQILEQADLQGVSVGKRTLEKHLRDVHSNHEKFRSIRAADDD